MNQIEIDFFEEYKKLDNLCKDILTTEQGVTNYIIEMEGTSPGKRSMVPSWESDYRNLKHVRWVRNDIAHGNGESECKQDDIDFVINFYQRIMNQTDPFGIIHKKETGKSVMPKQVIRQVNLEPLNNPYNYSPNYWGKSNNRLRIKWVAAIIIIAILLIMYVFMKL